MTSPDEPRESQQEGQQGEATRSGGPLRRHWLWIALAAAVAVAGVAAVNALGSGNAFPTAAGAHGSAAAGGATGAGGTAGGSHPNPDATHPVPVAIGSPTPIATSSSHLPRKVTASLSRWKAGPGGATLTVLSAQLGNALQAGGLKLYPTMRLACAKVGTEVTDARSGPPIPDAAMQGWYARALASLARAAADCQAAISLHASGDETLQAEVHPAALRRSKAEFATGARELFQATDKIRSLSQH